MIIFKSINKLNKEVNFKANIGFVPTMGSLHNGHISLIKSSKKFCKRTLVSIFINPAQFDKKNDLKKYPRNLKKDIKILKKLKVDYLLTPRVTEIYRSKKNTKIKLNKGDNLGLVIGSTKADMMENIRKLSVGLSWLVPGVGAQGGDLHKSVSISNNNGLGIINISRGILYAGNGSIDDIIKSAKQYTEQIRKIICNPITC